MMQTIMLMQMMRQMMGDGGVHDTYLGSLG